MKVKFNKKTGNTTITMDWTEARQFHSGDIKLETIQEMVIEAIYLVDGKKEKGKFAGIPAVPGT